MNVTVQIDPPNAPLFTTSAQVDLVCDLDVDSADGFDISFTWTGPNGILSDGSDYTITDQVVSSTLCINQIDVNRDNNAEYACSVTASQSNKTVRGHDSLTLPIQGTLKLTRFEAFTNINHATSTDKLQIPDKMPFCNIPDI